MMSGNYIIVEGDLEGSVYLSLKKGMESESHFFPSFSGGFKSRIIILSDNLRMGESSRESFSNNSLSMNNSESLFPHKFGGGENLFERLMPPLVLTEAERGVSSQRNEHVGFFVGTY